MKKIGFTLAEILVVLGIIGVVAALTLPSLMSNTASAQIGPKLAKAVAMFDQANAALLTEQGADSLLETGLLAEPIENENSYQAQFTNHLKASLNGAINTTLPTNFFGVDSVGTLTAKDGTVYAMYADTGKTHDTTKPAHKQIIGTVLLDIDGSSGANKPGTDIFAFTWWADGSLRPYGGTGSESGYDWKTQCKGEETNGNMTLVTDYWACAGHVFENNLKVKYE